MALRSYDIVLESDVALVMACVDEMLGENLST